MNKQLIDQQLPAMNLYWYQDEAVNALINFIETNPEGSPLVVAPTGSGKTHIIAGFCQRILSKKPTAKILVLAHVQEILEQNKEKLVKYLPNVEVGLYSASLKSRTVKQITVASINSAYKQYKLFSNFDYVIVDEAHRIPPTGEGMYRRLLDKMAFATLLGLTATPYRMGHGYITDGKLFTKIVYEVDMLRLIKEGYLSNVIAPPVEYEMDTSDIAIVGGDFSKKELSKKFDIDTITRRIVDEIITYKDTRKSWLIFAIDIEHAENINAILCEKGIRSAAIHSKLDVARSDIIDLFREGLIQALVSVETLTTGFDVPRVDLIAILRSTDSPTLHVQIIGRGMRVFPGKENCLILDFAGNIKNLGPINDPYIRKSGERRSTKEEALKQKIKTCPSCKKTIVLQSKVCECGYEFKSNVVKLTPQVSHEEILSRSFLERFKPREYTVTRVRYELHEKQGKASSLKVTYYCGLRSFKEWVALEHQGYPRRRAEDWWRYRAKTVPPISIVEALQRTDELSKPTKIYVDEKGKYPNIVRYKFD